MPLTLQEVCHKKSRPGFPGAAAIQAHGALKIVVSTMLQPVTGCYTSCTLLV